MKIEDDGTQFIPIHVRCPFCWSTLVAERDDFFTVPGSSVVRVRCAACERPFVVCSNTGANKSGDPILSPYEIQKITLRSRERAQEATSA